MRGGVGLLPSGGLGLQAGADMSTCSGPYGVGSLDVGWVSVEQGAYWSRDVGCESSSHLC